MSVSVVTKSVGMRKNKTPLALHRETDSVDDILNAALPTSVRAINPKLKSPFLDCCSITLQKIRQNLLDEAAWKLLILIQYLE